MDLVQAERVEEADDLVQPASAGVLDGLGDLRVAEAGEVG